MQNQIAAVTYLQCKWDANKNVWAFQVIIKIKPNKIKFDDNLKHKIKISCDGGESSTVLKINILKF